MDIKVDSQLTISAIDPDTSSIDANWIQNVSSNAVKISIVGTVPYDLLATSRVIADLNKAITGILCHQLVDIEQVE